MEIARVFLDVNMSLSFGGLTDMMKKAKLKPDAWPSGRFVIFINRKQSAFKVLINNQFLVYHNTGGRKFPLEAIQHFPDFFDGRRIDFDAAVSKVLKAKVFIN